MSSLDPAFAELRRKLQSIDRLNPTQSDPFFHFVHRPEQTAEVVDAIRRFRATLETDGWKVRVVSLAATMWGVIDASGRWSDWREVEAEADPAEALRAVADALRTKPEFAQAGLARAILEIVADETPNRLVFLTDAGLLHPFFRVRVIEEFVHDRVRAPSVLFYPGTRVGEFGLRFLGIYPEDPNYRSCVVGGDL